MLDIGLIITFPIMSCLIILGCFYFLVYFISPEDKWVAWAPKILFIFCMSLACFNVLMLPLDVANKTYDDTANGGIPLRQIAIICFMTSISLVFTLVPFCVFWYEGIDDGSGSSQLGHAMKWTLPTIVVITLLFVMTWLFERKTSVDVAMYISPMMPVANGSLNFNNIQPGCTRDICSKYTYSAEKNIGFVIFVMGISSCLGWFILAAFGGIGMASLPIDLVVAFVDRPKPITLDVYSKKKIELLDETKRLMISAESIAERQKKDMTQKVRRKLKLEEAAFKRDVMNLEKKYTRNEDSYRRFGGNALLGYIKFLVGCMGAVLSFMWVLHSCLYLLPKYWDLDLNMDILNQFFVTFDEQDIPFLGTFFYGLFSFWLMMCVIKGNTKMGMRILFVAVHPLK
eukprot:NODE_942_length_2988_cov_1.180339.p1 type:complete len:399 gc:universal NODE_942_length_2988_cov_1.180339:1160-2356(+)